MTWTLIKSRRFRGANDVCALSFCLLELAVNRRKTTVLIEKTAFKIKHGFYRIV